MSDNHTINKLLQNGEITQEEYDILFVDKSTWYPILENGERNWDASKDNSEIFYKALKKTISILNQQDKIDLSRINFASFNFDYYEIDTNKGIYFDFAHFYHKANFKHAKFNNHAYFSHATFDHFPIFSNAYFTGEAVFLDALFMEKVYFSDTVFNGETLFSRAKLTNEASFQRTTFNDKVTFDSAAFNSEAHFKNALFRNEANFRSVTFKKAATFENATFTLDAFFGNAKFVDEANLSRTKFKENLYAYKMQFTKLNLIAIEFQNANLLGISAYDEPNPNGKVLTKSNFDNKETARLIKSHFDAQHNITESNKYFALEQELYLDELKSPASTEPNKYQTITALYFNKYVSNFGTDWLRSLIILFIIGYIVMIGYMTFDDIGWLEADKDNYVKHFSMRNYSLYALLMITGGGFIYNYTLSKNKPRAMAGFILIGWVYCIAYIHNLEIRAFTNYIVQITNPIGAFKDIELYKGIEFYATIVRITIAIIIYQLIVAFRNNTRRS